MSDDIVVLIRVLDEDEANELVDWAAQNQILHPVRTKGASRDLTIRHMMAGSSQVTLKPEEANLAMQVKLKWGQAG